MVKGLSFYWKPPKELNRADAYKKLITKKCGPCLNYMLKVLTANIPVDKYTNF